jgi:hypothetical protein
LANLEQRASLLREELRDLERGFTPDYLAKDPKIVAERARLTELERQIVAQRAAGQQTAILEAQEDLASAQAAAARIQKQMLSSRQEASQFNTRFNEYKSRQDELGGMPFSAARNSRPASEPGRRRPSFWRQPRHRKSRGARFTGGTRRFPSAARSRWHCWSCGWWSS